MSKSRLTDFIQWLHLCRLTMMTKLRTYNNCLNLMTGVLASRCTVCDLISSLLQNKNTARQLSVVAFSWKCNALTAPKGNKCAQWWRNCQILSLSLSLSLSNYTFAYPRVLHIAQHWQHRWRQRFCQSLWWCSSVALEPSRSGSQ